MGKKRIGDTVRTSDGHKGEVIQTDPDRKLVAVKITEPGTPGRKAGEEVVYKEKEVR